MDCKTKKLFKMGMQGLLLTMLLSLFTGCASNTTAVKETDKQSTESAKPKLIIQISTSENSESSTVWVKGNQLLTFTSVKQSFPLSVLLYFPETGLDNIDTDYKPDSEIVGSIKAFELATKGHTSRIEIFLKKDTSYDVTREDNGLKISFKKASAMTTPAESSTKKQKSPGDKLSDNAKPPVSSVQKETSPETAAPVLSEKKEPIAKTAKNESVTQQVTKTKPAWIDRIDFSSEKDGKSTVIIGTTTPVKYNLEKINDNKLLLNIYNTRLPDYRRRPLITTRFKSAVNRITPFQTPAMKDTSGLLIELRESVPYFIEQTENLIILNFGASSLPPKPLNEAKLPSWQRVAQKAVAEPEAATPEGFESETYNAQGTKYTGEKIALNFYETDIKSAFRIIMDVSGKNFAIDKDVSGKVTLTFDKPVPWDQVLDLILKMNRLGRVSEGDIIRIATLKTLRTEEEERQARIAEMQKFNEQKKALEPLITAYIPVNYANAKTDVLPHIVLTEGRGSVTVDERNNQVIITDTYEKVQQAKKIVKQIDKVTPQVIIEARIVEASDNFSREFGTTWAITGTKKSSSSLGGTLGYDMSAVNPPTTTRGEIGIQFARLIGDQFKILDARLMASESEGTLKIISAPKILTLDNKSAVIKQGIAYPYNLLDADGNTTTEFKDIVLELDVTPHITPDNRVAMKITIKNNELGAIINGQASFTTKEAFTELLVDDGDTIVIGGIRKTKQDISEKGVPLLNKIPLLSWLFKTASKAEEKQELLIFITPRIVQLEQVGSKS